MKNQTSSPPPNITSSTLQPDISEPVIPTPTTPEPAVIDTSLLNDLKDL